MLLFTGDVARSLGIFVLLFCSLVGLLAWVSYWAFKQTDYYQTQWHQESIPIQAVVLTIGLVVVIALSWLLFFG